MESVPRIIPVAVVPDATMRQFLEAAEVVLRASWGVADVANPVAQHPALPQIPNPKQPAIEAIQSLDYALKAAICGDGADAVIGFAMVTKSLSAKALSMRAEGMMGPPAKMMLFGQQP